MTEILLDKRDIKNGELQTFMYLIEQGAFKEVSEDTYSSFIKDHIKKGVIPCKASLVVMYMRKRIGVCYVELVEDGARNDDTYLGIGPDPYSKKYPEHFACYGWLEMEDGCRNFFLNPKIYPSWFNQNIEHLDTLRAIRSKKHGE